MNLKAGSGDSLSKLGTIHVDMDSQELAAASLGYGNNDTAPDAYVKALDALLALFEDVGVKATLFVVGKDLNHPEIRRALSRAAGMGHELASHSLSHSFRFGELPDQEVHRELTTASRELAEISGCETVGFRAPGFTLSPKLIHILQECGYTYDSSLWATWFAGLARFIVSMTTRQKATKYMYGSWKGTRSPLLPYRVAPDRSLYSPGAGTDGIWEIPVSSLPLLRIPAHNTYINKADQFRLGYAYAGFAAVMYRALAPFVCHLFHLFEFYDPVETVLAKKLGLVHPLSRRIDVARKILRSLGAHFRFLPGRDIVRELSATENTEESRCNAEG